MVFGGSHPSLRKKNPHPRSPSHIFLRETTDVGEQDPQAWADATLSILMSPYGKGMFVLIAILVVAWAIRIARGK